MVGRLQWIEMADTVEPEVIDRSKVAREIQSSNEEVTQHISTF